MRNRTEIEEEIKSKETNDITWEPLRNEIFARKIQLEILLDIRELLIKLPVQITGDSAQHDKEATPNK